MRKLFTILAAVLLTANVFAQAPQKMSYQAVIRNSNNILVTSASIGMRISILQGSVTGTEVFKEIYNPNPQTNANGLVTIEIGSGIPLIGTFASINWANGPYFLKTEADPAGGTSYSITGTSELLSVPYAQHAKLAENLSGGITASQISDFQTSVTNNPTVLANTTKLTGIADGAEVNVNADWNATSGDAQILNKPTTVASYGITDAVITSGDQTIAGNKTFTGAIIGTLNANNTKVSNVATPTSSQDAATKAYVDALQSQIAALENNLINAGIKVRDIDSNIYNTVRIGTQTWMKENLRVTKYRNGVSIGTTTPATLDISPESTPKYQWAFNGNESNAAIYGRLYTYYAATDSLNICPVSWHVPTDADWTTLTDYLTNNGFGYQGSGNDIGKSMAATSGWNTNAVAGNVGNDQSSNNSSAFTALPGGNRDYAGAFLSSGNFGIWWSSSEFNSVSSWYQYMYNNNNNVGRGNGSKSLGLSVRCIRDY